MLQSTNGNLYRTNQNTGVTRRARRIRKYAATGSRFKGYADMPLTPVARKQALDTVKSVESRAEEWKSYDTITIGPYSATNTPTPIDMTNMPPDKTNGARIGDEIIVKDIELRFDIGQATAITAESYQGARCIIVQYYGDNTTAFSAGTFLSVTGAAGITLSPYNHDNRRLYKILYDERFDLVYNGTALVHRTVLVKPGRKKVRFDASTLGGDGHIYVMFMSDISGSNTPGYNYTCRINYVDS